MQPHYQPTQLHHRHSPKGSVVVRKPAEISDPHKPGLGLGGQLSTPQHGGPLLAHPSCCFLTEEFWHCRLELLKRRAVTRAGLPGMWKRHS